MKHKVLAMLAAALIMLGLGGCSKDDKSSGINVAELEKGLVGVWWDEYEYSDVTETGVPFSRVLLVVKADADHTGCIYLGLFDDTGDKPLAVYGGPEEAGFTWQLLQNGNLKLAERVTDESGAQTRSSGNFGSEMTDVSSTNMSYNANCVTMSNGDYSGTLEKADAQQEAEILKKLSMPQLTAETNLSSEDDVNISDTPQNTWGR